MFVARFSKVGSGGASFERFIRSDSMSSTPRWRLKQFCMTILFEVISFDNLAKFVFISIMERVDRFTSSLYLFATFLKSENVLIPNAAITAATKPTTIVVHFQRVAKKSVFSLTA